MKRTVRQEQSIIIYFGFYGILFISLLVFFFQYILPSISEVEQKKVHVQDLEKDIDKIKKEGVSYADLKASFKNSSLDNYTKELVTKSVDKDFYNRLLVNTKEKTFEDFLVTIENDLENPKRLQALEKQEKQLFEILPTYSEHEIEGVDVSISDFEIVQYVEEVLATFNLKHKNQIGITDLVLLEGFSDPDNKSKLDTNIFYIPMSFDIEGAKKYDIINFLYFLEKLGNIHLQGDNIIIHDQEKEEVLTRGTAKITLKNDVIIDNYNIYENQLIDIESIQFDDFIEDWNDLGNKRESYAHLYQRVKNNQRTDKMDMTINLRFYIKGIQNIKMIQHLENYVKYFNLTKKLVTVEYKKQLKNKDVSQSMRKAQSTLNELTKELKTIRISIGTQEDLAQNILASKKHFKNLNAMHESIGYHHFVRSVLTDYKVLESDTTLEQKNIDLFHYIQNISEDISQFNKRKSESVSEYNARINGQSQFNTMLNYYNIIELKR
ncbi:MAG: hypothetical protein GY828_07345 [Candidatus Gracilibacteria bacterium]|nr:hypothetical protein [Candidatus Gracilibacteria bacterium]